MGLHNSIWCIFIILRIGKVLALNFLEPFLNDNIFEVTVLGEGLSDLNLDYLNGVLEINLSVANWDGTYLPKLEYNLIYLPEITPRKVFMILYC